MLSEASESRGSRRDCQLRACSGRGAEGGGVCTRRTEYLSKRPLPTLVCKKGAVFSGAYGIVCFKTLSHSGHDMGTLSCLNVETLERVPSQPNSMFV